MHTLMSVNKCFFLIIILMLNVFFHQSAVASSAVWKISKEGSYFYLGGTIHVLTATDHPLPSEFSTAYKDSNIIYFETDLDAMQLPKYQSKIMAEMSNRDGQTLADQLDTKTYTNLTTYLTARHLSPAQFDSLQPWAASLMLTMMEYQRLGMLPDYGVDTYFNKRAQDDGMKRMSLETPDAQLAALSSMSKIDPNDYVQYTLEDLERLPEFITEMKTAWRKGDIASLSKIDMIKTMKTDFPEIYNTLLTNRNNNWMKELVRLNDDKNTEFVLVGALHLYGEDGLLVLLAQAGFKITQL